MRLRLHGSRDIREDRHLSSGPRVMMERASGPHHDRHETSAIGQMTRHFYCQSTELWPQARAASCS